MSLVTRCTACGTLFKVVADQLKISDGWVRCGQCAHVFDAQANLVSETPPVAATPVSKAPVAAPSPAIAAPVFTPSPPTMRPAAAPLLRTLAPAPVAMPISERVSKQPLGIPTPMAASAPASPLVDPISDRITPEDLLDFKRSRAISMSAELEPSLPPPSLPPTSTFRESDFNILLTESASPSSQMPDSQQFKPGRLRDSTDLPTDAGPSTNTWASSEFAPHISKAPISMLPEVSSTAAIDTLASPLPTPSFVAQAQRAARWRSPWARFGLGLLALALMAALALQVVLQEKDRIAALRPSSKPWLEQLCQAMACRVQAYQQIESILVDASSFNKVNKTESSPEAKIQSYKLAVTLKNIGALPVALPHVELSLQDAQEQPVLRRVLSPADLGALQTSLQPSADFAGNLTVQIDTTQLASARISGYRVLAFYP